VCADGYTAPIFRKDLEKGFFAVRDGNGMIDMIERAWPPHMLPRAGALLSIEHGGPRIVVPSLWVRHACVRLLLSAVARGSAQRVSVARLALLITGVEIGEVDDPA
jgi:hypothetical protein